MKTINIPDIIESVVIATGQRLGMRINWDFGSPSYLFTQLALMAGSQSITDERYPLIFMIGDFPVSTGGASDFGECTFNFLLAMSADNTMSNKDRNKLNFERVLRPMYECFLDSLYKSRDLSVPDRDAIQGTYTERFDYAQKQLFTSGGVGVECIDAIEFTNVRLRIKSKSNC